MPTREILDRVTHVHYETDDRGSIWSFGTAKNGKTLKLKFSDIADEVLRNGEFVNVYYGSVQVSRPREPGSKALVPVEQGRELIAAIEQSNAYYKKRVRYVLSPEERRIEAKKRKQEANLEQLRENLESGIYQLNLVGLTSDQLRKLAEDIGVRATSAAGNDLPVATIRKGIADKLGYADPSLKETKEAAEVKARPVRGRPLKAKVKQKDN